MRIVVARPWSVLGLLPGFGFGLVLFVGSVVASVLTWPWSGPMRQLVTMAAVPLFSLLYLFAMLWRVLSAMVLVVHEGKMGNPWWGRHSVDLTRNPVFAIEGNMITVLEDGADESRDLLFVPGNAWRGLEADREAARVALGRVKNLAALERGRG